MTATLTLRAVSRAPTRAHRQPPCLKAGRPLQPPAPAFLALAAPAVPPSGHAQDPPAHRIRQILAAGAPVERHRSARSSGRLRASRTHRTSRSERRRPDQSRAPRSTRSADICAAVVELLLTMEHPQPRHDQPECRPAGLLGRTSGVSTPTEPNLAADRPVSWHIAPTLKSLSALSRSQAAVQGLPSIALLLAGSRPGGMS
jgi:hypothetical protein